jgi:hypothetical protein
VAIGAYAGQTGQGNNSIILNATGANLDQTTANTFTVAPVRNDTSNIAEVMFYNTTSKEVTYGNTISVAGNITGAYVLGNGSGLTSLPIPTVSQDITSNGAMSIMTYDGNLKYVNYATVEPSTGNIAGGNISTTGNLSAGNANVTGNINAGNIYATNIVAEASFSIQTANFNANVGGRYGVNTTGGAVTATLPATPATGGAVFFADAGGTYAANNLIINPNGQTIMGASGNMTVSTNNQSVGLFYNGATWRTYNAG